MAEDLITLREANQKKKHGYTMKWEPYFEIYDYEFRDISRETRINLLEIGIAGGGSLWMWREFFPNATIFGLDINESCREYASPEDGIHVYIGGQEDPVTLSDILGHSLVRGAGLDIVIDDGGHTMMQQQGSFEILFPYVKEHGIYCIEDLHTSYFPRFGGKYREDTSTIEYLKRGLDKLNWWARRDPQADDLPKGYPKDILEKNLYSMHFYDSLCFIRKRATQLPTVILENEGGRVLNPLED